MRLPSSHSWLSSNLSSGHYLGTLEGLNGLILKFGYKGDKTKVSLGKLNTISMIFIMGSTVVAYASEHPRPW